MKKRHGLWRFHYEARKARETYSNLPIRWWVEEERWRLGRMIECLHSGYGGRQTWSNADAVVVCAKRFMRRFGGVRTVQQWNSLVRKIAERAGYTHHATMRAAEMHYAHRQKSPIFFHASNFGECRSGRPWAKFSIDQIEDRHLSILMAKRKRIERENEERYRSHRSLIEQVWETKQAIAAINKAIKSAQAAIKEKA